MKAKILTALKTRYGNLGFGDKAFDGVADYLSKTVTEETQIETAIGGVESLLKAFQGDIDKVRGESNAAKVELEKLKGEKAELEKSIQKTPEPQKSPKGDDLDAMVKIISDQLNEQLTKQLNEKLVEQLKPLQDRITANETKEATEKREARILAKAQELQIPQFRIDEGFTIAADADDAAINTYLSKVKQNMVTAGLEKKTAFGEMLATSDDAAKGLAKTWAEALPDAKK